MSGRLTTLLSGKGGVGRTMLAASLGTLLARGGKRTALVDLNTGMRGLDMALGLESRAAFDLGDVLDGVCGVKQALCRGEDGLCLLAGRQVCDTEALDERRLEKIIAHLRTEFDWVLLDAAGGIGRGLTAAARLGGEAIAVTTPDDAAIRCAERAAGVWTRSGGQTPMLCVNRIDAALVQEKLQYLPETCAQVLDMYLLGVVPEDEQALRAGLKKQPVCGDFPAARGIENLLSRLENPKEKLWNWNPQPEKKQPFWRRRKA